jgi:putative addiction module CopG family antidote
MSIQISPDLQQFVHQVIAAGNYKNENEVVDRAIRLLQQRQQRIDELRREVQPALDQLDRGEGVELANEHEIRQFFDDVKERGKQRIKSEQKPQ